MNKELTPLEALERIKNYIIAEYLYGWSREEIKKVVEETLDFKSIETALKDGEWYKKEMIKFEKAFTEENEEKLKLKQALKIIKEKGFKELSVVEDICNWDYQKYLELPCSKLYAKEEFDLLKEVLK